MISHSMQAGPLDLSTPSRRKVARRSGSVARFESEHKGATYGFSTWSTGGKSVLPE